MRTRRLQSSSDPVLSTKHRTVLLHEAVESLAIEPGDSVVDATLGGAGHAEAITRLLSAEGTFIGVDADKRAIARSEERLAGAAPHMLLIEGNFRNLKSLLNAQKIREVSKVLFDLGWSTYQLGEGRGFSFLSDEPLDMRYGKSLITAHSIVNEWDEESIANVLFGWGEERFSRRIAKAIIEARAKHPIETARELGELVREAYPSRFRNGKTHPATKTFQALRIAVNDEIGAVREGLFGAWSLLPKKGRIAVITFHSIEDREVKTIFRKWEDDGEGKRIYKKPLTPSKEELEENPRARSAKLRVIEKI